MPIRSHDKDHVRRVLELAMYIGKKEGADLSVVKRAAELHDIGREVVLELNNTREKGANKNQTLRNHALVGASKARELLNEIGEDNEFIEKVCHCIEAHSFTSGIVPSSLEAKVLSDADKLDAIGAIGVARAFIYSGERGRSITETINHFDEKLLKLKFETKTGKEIAQPKMEFLVRFYEKIKSELYFSRLEE